MTIDEILQLEDKKKAFEILTTDTKKDRKREDYLAEYKGKRERREKSVDKRENKRVAVYSETETELDKDGNEVPKKTGHDEVVVAKAHTNMPKRIVTIATAFLFGGEMQVTFAEESDGAQLFKENVEDKLKLKSVFNKFARTVKTETKAAIVFYPRPSTDEDGKAISEVKLKILSLKNGDFFPHFDDYDDMDAFVRSYTAVHTDGEEREFIWIQTASEEYKFVKIDNDYVPVEGFPLKNLAGKITVVYAEQDDPEWEEVANLIDYYENRLSRMIDTNDYFGDPILKNFGNSALPSKDTVGKQLTFPKYVDPETGKEFHGDAEYLVWQQSIDSIKQELETLRDEIYSGSSTPNLSFDNVKGIGGLSGTAIELMFLEAFIKAAEGMEIFGPVVQRCVSVIKAMMSNVTNTMYAEDLKKSRPRITFTSILPKDIKELVDVLLRANGDKPINSQETIVSHSPFTKDATEELLRLKKEAEEENKRTQMTGITL